MDKIFPSHSSLMTRRNTRQRQPSPPSAERSAEDSQNALQHGNATIPSNHTSQTRRTHCHASQPGVGEEIDITLSDENSSVPSSRTLKLPSLSLPRPITLSRYALLPRLRVDHMRRRLKMSNISFKDEGDANHMYFMQVSRNFIFFQSY